MFSRVSVRATNATHRRMSLASVDVVALRFGSRLAPWTQFLMRASVIAFVAVSAALAPSSVHAQQASFGGTVLSEAGEKPVRNAEIVLEGLNRSVRSDSAGNFMFTGLSAGKHSILIRLIGFEPFKTDITLGATQKLEADLFIKPAVTTLSNVDVTAAKTPMTPYAAKLTDFENRRKLGVGKFMTADDFEKGDGRPVSGMLTQKISGLRIVQSNGRRWLASARGGGVKLAGGVSGSGEKIPPGCYMQVIVNGRIEYNGEPGQNPYDVDQLNSRDIIGLEFYTTATTPLEYNATRGSTMGSCGTVVIWTKGG